MNRTNTELIPTCFQWASGRQYILTAFSFPLPAGPTLVFTASFLPLSEASFPRREGVMGPHRTQVTRSGGETLLWWTGGTEEYSPESFWHSWSTSGIGGEMGLDYQELYNGATSWERLVRKVSPGPYWEGRAHCPVTRNQLERTGVGPREDSLSMGSNSDDPGPSPWDRKAGAYGWMHASTRPLWINSRIWARTHHTLLFSHSLFKSLKVKRWTFPLKQIIPCDSPTHRLSPLPLHLLTHAYHILLQNMWGQHPNYLVIQRHYKVTQKNLIYFLFTNRPWMKD